MAYQRKTVDNYAIMTNYGYGWEEKTAEETFKDAKNRMREYLENTNAYVKIVKRRENKIDSNSN